MKWILILTFFSLASFANQNSEMLQAIGTLERFTFGSCNKENFPQPYWYYMTKKKSQLFLMAGDNIYGDAKRISRLRRKYARQAMRKDFQRFISHTPFIGTWDDHDYGLNNSNANINDKRERQELFLNFFKEPKNSPRRLQKGIYTSYTFGKLPKQAKFILLDTRYFKDTTTDGENDLLGEDQWIWLERELRESKAQVNFIVSSVTVHLDERGRKAGEEWNDYPYSQGRLFSLVDKYTRGKTIFLTGDKHFAAYLEKDFNGETYPEFLSSSLTHPSFPVWHLFDPNRTTFLRLTPNFGFVTLDWMKNGDTKVTYNIISSYTGRTVRSYPVIIKK